MRLVLYNSLLLALFSTHVRQNMPAATPAPPTQGMTTKKAEMQLSGGAPVLSKASKGIWMQPSPLRKQPQVASYYYSKTQLGAALKTNQTPDTPVSKSETWFGFTTLSCASSVTSLISSFLIVKSGINNTTPELLRELREFLMRSASA